MFSPAPHRLSRRSVLSLATSAIAIGSGAALLSACGGSGSTGASTIVTAGAASTTSAVTSTQTTASAVTTAVPKSVTSQTSSTVGSVPAASASAPTGQVVTISALHLWSADGLAVQKQFDQRFMASHPDIRVSLENQPFSSDVAQKLLALAASNSLPDVLRAHPNYEVRFASAGLWTDLTPYVGRTPGFNLEGDFMSVSLQYHRRNGKLDAIPFTAGTYVLFYNKDLFDKAGLAYPTEQWTFTADFLEAVQKLTQPPGPSRSVGWSGQMPGMNVWTDPVQLHPWGGAFLDDAETTCKLDQQPARDALSWWLDLARKYKVTPTPEDQIKGDAFASGRVALYYQLPLELLTLQQSQVKFNWDVVQLPSGPVTRSTGIGAGGYGLTTSSKHLAEAWTYLDAYTSTDGQTFMFADTGQDLPGRKSAWPAFSKRPGNPAHVQAFFDAAANAITLRPFGAEGPDVLDKAAPIWADALSGKRDVNSVTSDLCRVVDAALRQAGS